LKSCPEDQIAESSLVGGQFPLQDPRVQGPVLLLRFGRVEHPQPNNGGYRSIRAKALSKGADFDFLAMGENLFATGAPKTRDESFFRPHS